MERVEKMIQTLEKEIVQSVNNRQEQLIQSFYTEKEDITKHMENIITSLMDKNTDCIVISFLRSSYITESHKYKITGYNGEPFLDEFAKSEYYYMKFFNVVNEDIEVFISLLRKSYIRILSSEIEEIRRYYMNILYESSIEFFRHVINAMTNISFIHQVDIFFGEEMGDIIQIGAIQEKNKYERVEINNIGKRI